MGTLEMDFNYAEIFGASSPDAYQRLLLDCMAGDQTLFTRIDNVQLAWELIDKVLADWRQRDCEPYFYPAGAESFSQADALIQREGRNWRKISEM
jgi:glucose-6-phosphate 1-dehydrogenase